jgi:hypothetical protein
VKRKVLNGSGASETMLPSGAWEQEKAELGKNKSIQSILVPKRSLGTLFLVTKLCLVTVKAEALPRKDNEGIEEKNI